MRSETCRRLGASRDNQGLQATRGQTEWMEPKVNLERRDLQACRERRETEARCGNSNRAGSQISQIHCRLANAPQPEPEGNNWSQ